MAPYRIRLLSHAKKELSKLDRSTARRIVDRLDWLAENYANITPQPLSGEFAGLFKLRIGSYRVIYQHIKEEEVLIVYRIAHRRNVYSGI